ncbi:serine/threonine-protein kinase polo [Phlebotomus argentipes]|uniref:serine/threonine-protein kinase polo n=1 Tax=Phlebotomus argentipes TaxID=94469 RepID=UPI002893145E|nr:serine/threonine-protein kinase polo [Phlebotomus argentipes]
MTSARKIDVNTATDDIPLELYDASTKIKYQRARYFGKGGFAKCYEIIDVSNHKAYAGKVVPKKLMVKESQKEKMTQEIAIHRSLNHKNIVQFHSFFDDKINIYIVLELCQRRSMMELHKRRKSITDFECRYYIYQILQGLKYLHDLHVIHRDIKLGNLFLNEEMTVKIGDFGLATKIEFEGQRKETICGTPNYIAPEILNRKGHSYEADIWSVGCVMYTLLVGRPPFETKSLKDTYSKIRKCEYKIPNVLRTTSADMIVAMLQSQPSKRPSVNKLFRFEFLMSNPIPVSLPTSCLTMPPRADQLEYIESVGNRKPLSMVNGVISTAVAAMKASHKPSPQKEQMKMGPAYPNDKAYHRDVRELQRDLHVLLAELDKKPSKTNAVMTLENTDPASQPMYWVSKWVDYSDKYGFGYQLCDEGVGVLFNDATKLIILSNGINVHFIDRNGGETYMTMDQFPQEIDKKIRLLTYFKRYMSEHLVKTGASNVTEFDGLSRVPHLYAWFRTNCAVIMYLTNGTVQLNFSDHVKIILCPRMQAVTVIEPDKNFRTYTFTTILESGCSADLLGKIRYAAERLGTCFEEQ